MNAYKATTINAAVLILMSAWAYFSSSSPSVTALIPAMFGLILFACAPGVKNENKVISHIAVLLTALLIIALFMPFKGALAREDAIAILRVLVMLATSLFSMVYFIKSFIDVRKQRVSS